MTESKFSILIIGAGIAGLAAGIALAEAGHSVTILEAAPQLSAIGAGIQLPPNSVRLLSRLGVYDEVAKYSSWPKSALLKRWQNGDVISEVPLLPNTEDVYGAPYLLIHRADVHHVLVSKARAVGVKIQLNTFVSLIDQSQPSVALSDGSKVHADLIIGADGLKSNVRRAVLDGDDVNIRFSPSCVYRTLIPASAMQEKPELQALIDSPAALYWVGPKGHIIGYPISNGTMYNFVLCDSSLPPVGLVSKVVPLSEVQARFRDWDPIVRQLIDLIPEPLKWQLSEIEEVPSWVSKSGTVVIIGDASHAMVPHLAQGAAMALEDAVALAVFVNHAGNEKDLPALMKNFQDLRRERCYQILREAREMGEAWHLPDGPDQERRDQQMKQSGRKNWAKGIDKPNPNRWDDSEFQPILFGYDAHKEATKYIESRIVGQNLNNGI